MAAGVCQRDRVPEFTFQPILFPELKKGKNRSEPGFVILRILQGRYMESEIRS